MPNMKEKPAEKKKIKKKISKAQMQLAILKKKQCDIKALLIVERLLEPNVDPEWLLQNLGQINKSHMEDVIEERAIIKLCGYILCQNPLTVTITQQYHISTRNNKVYDVTRRKNFCSSRCYGASSYLLEQMLTSPLWLRDTEEIPVFQLLEATNAAERSVPGEEVLVQDFSFNVDKDAEQLNSVAHQTVEEVIPNDIEESIRKIQDIQNEKIIKEDSTVTSNTPTTMNSNILCNSNQTNLENIISISETLENVALKEVNELQQVSEFSTTESNSHIQVINKFDNLTISNKELNDTVVNADKLDNITDQDMVTNVEFPKKTNEQYNKKAKLETNSKCKKYKKKSCNNIKDQSTKFYTLVAHIEQCVKEWITDDTLNLLSGEDSARYQFLEHVTQHDRCVQLCKKLKRMQLEEEKDDSDVASTTLKPLPHLSDLQEEGKKIELKVRAFYQGNVVMEQPGSSMDVVEDVNESAPILPLIDAHAPKALRRRIFLEKLHKILPDLLLALSSPQQSYSSMHYNYSEHNVLVKALVNTFALSATNIIFKSSEWTLAGLIIIKMLSILDLQLKNLLGTKQASMYISMILMSYKLDSNYLDRLIIEITDNTEIFNLTPKTFV